MHTCGSTLKWRDLPLMVIVRISVCFLNRSAKLSNNQAVGPRLNPASKGSPPPHTHTHTTHTHTHTHTPHTHTQGCSVFAMTRVGFEPSCTEWGTNEVCSTCRETCSY